MSYYGIKNLKIVKTEEGKYNLACEYYDSSIRSYEGYRVWHKDERFFAKDFDTKAELEEELFKHFLDGNLHTSGNCGKFQCLSWTNRQLEPSEQECEELAQLEQAYHENWSEDRRTAYYNRRYEIYRALWKQYLADKKAHKLTKFIVKLNAMGYKDIYVKGLGSMRCKYTAYEERAKVFTGNPQLTLRKLNGFPNQDNIRVIMLDK